jgi:hypothetical protein
MRRRPVREGIDAPIPADGAVNRVLAAAAWSSHDLYPAKLSAKNCSRTNLGLSSIEPIDACFGAQPAARTPDGLVLAGFFCAPALC